MMIVVFILIAIALYVLVFVELLSSGRDEGSSKRKKVLLILQADLWTTAVTTVVVQVMEEIVEVVEIKTESDLF